MTIWVFGDSFAEDYFIPDQWMKTFARNTNHELKCFGLEGTSLEYTYSQFNSIRDDIKKEDILIICLTSSHRRWFFPEPTLSSLTDIIYSTNDKPLKNYRLYLDNPKLPLIYLTNFLFNINHISKKLNLKTLIIPVFYEMEDILKDKRNLYPFFQIAYGNFNDTCLEESDTKFHKIFFDSRDPRINHFCFTNHNVIANKLKNWILENDSVDLRTDFHKNLFNKNNLNENFISKELFGKIPHPDFYNV